MKLIILIVLSGILIGLYIPISAQETKPQIVSYWEELPKETVCRFYADGSWVGPLNGMSKPHVGQMGEVALQVDEVLLGSNDLGFFKSDKTLSYLVTQSRGKGLLHRNFFSLYTYNCVTEKPKRILSPREFQKIFAKLDKTNAYEPYQILWQDSQNIVIRLELKAGKGYTECAKHIFSDSDMNCHNGSYYGYYEVHITPETKTFTLLKRSSYDMYTRKDGSYTY